MGAWPVDVDSSKGSVASEELESLKTELLSSAREARRGFGASRSQLVSLRALATRLEAFPSVDAPVQSPLLLGMWTLAFTDAADVLGLDLLPVEVGAITQEIQLAAGGDGESFVALNSVAFEPLGAAYLGALGVRAAAQYTVQGVCRAIDERRVSLIFTGGSLEQEVQLLKQGLETKLPRLSGYLPEQLEAPLRSLTESRVFLDTSYLDDDLRIARGPGGEMWVLART